MSIDRSILLDAHNIVYKDADGHDYGSFDQNMQDACNFAMVMTGSIGDYRYGICYTDRSKAGTREAEPQARQYG